MKTAQTMHEILASFPDEVARFSAGEDLDQKLYEALYAYWTAPERGDEGMPYGTAKARDGDPYNWIGDRIDDEFKAAIFALDSPKQARGK